MTPEKPCPHVVGSQQCLTCHDYTILWTTITQGEAEKTTQWGCLKKLREEKP